MVNTSLKQASVETKEQGEAHPIQNESLFSGRFTPGSLGVAISFLTGEQAERRENIRGLAGAIGHLFKDERLGDLMDFCRKTGHSIPLCAEWTGSKDVNLHTIAVTENGIEVCKRRMDPNPKFTYLYGKGPQFDPMEIQRPMTFALALRNAGFASSGESVLTTFNNACDAIKSGKLPEFHVTFNRQSYR